MNNPPEGCPKCGKSGYADVITEYVGGEDSKSNIGEEGYWVESYYTCSCGCEWTEYYKFEKWKLNQERQFLHYTEDVKAFIWEYALSY